MLEFNKKYAGNWLNLEDKHLDDAYELRGGIRFADMRELFAKLKSFKTVAGKLDDKKGVSFEPPINPHFLRGVDYIEINDELHEKKSGKLNILYCHGMEGLERENPVEDWMLKPETSEDIRDVPVLEVAQRILSEGESLDALIVCNKGAYPKDTEQYPFLGNMLYGRTKLLGNIGFYPDGKSYIHIVYGELVVPESLGLEGLGFPFHERLKPKGGDPIFKKRMMKKEEERKGKSN